MKYFEIYEIQEEKKRYKNIHNVIFIVIYIDIKKNLIKIIYKYKNL